MANIWDLHSIGEQLDAKPLCTSLSWTAGGASDSVTWTGISINRGAFAGGVLPRFVDVDVFYDATLGSGHTLSLYYDVQNSADNSTWTDFATEATTVVATGPSGGGRVVGVSRMSLAGAAGANAPAGTPGVDLSGAAKFVRLNLVPHLSATGTDTAIVAAIGNFAGFDTLAAPQT